MILKINRLKTALSDGTALPFRAWRFFLRCTKEFAAHHLSAYAAQMTFYLMLAVFPLTMLICVLTQLLPVSAERMQETLTLLLPDYLSELAVTLTEGYFNENVKGIRLWLLLFLIWSCARLILALMNAFNSISGIHETRGQLHLRLIGCGYTVILSLMFVAALTMLGFGYRILDLLGERSSEILPIAWLPVLIRNLISPAMLLLIFWCSYVFLPSRRPKFRNTFWGALLTALFWRGVAALYTVFLQRSMERYSYIYGGLAGLVLLLLWIYACMYCWLLGAELNRLLQERSASLKLPTR